MSRTTAIALFASILVALWLLHPTRQLTKVEGANVVEITYMGPGGPLKDVKADVIREFERESELAHARDPSKPIYRVISGQHAAKNQVGDPTRFLISLAGGSPPDVLEFDRFAIAEWAARGAFEPLDPYIARDLSMNRPDTPTGDQYYPVAWNEAQFNGRQYGIPIAIDSRALIYNKNVLRSAGFVDEKGEPLPPRTWEQVREYSRKLTTRDARGRLTRLGFAPMFGDSWLYMYGWMNGGEFMSEDGIRVTLNDPRIVEALSWLKRTYDELGGYGHVKSFEASFLVDALDPFVTGQIAMKIDGNWQMERLGKFARDVDFGVAPPPVPQNRYEAGHTRMSWTGGFAIAIPSTSRNKEAAWELIRFLSSERAHKLSIEGERQLSAAQGRFYIPNQSPNIRLNEWTFQHVVYDDPSIPQKYKDACRAFNELLPHARFRPITPVGQLLWNCLLYTSPSPRDRGYTVRRRRNRRWTTPTEKCRARSTGFFIRSKASPFEAGTGSLCCTARCCWWRGLRSTCGTRNSDFDAGLEDGSVCRSRRRRPLSRERQAVSVAINGPEVGSAQHLGSSASSFLVAGRCCSRSSSASARTTSSTRRFSPARTTTRPWFSTTSLRRCRWETRSSW
jgi:multiple sugar transport system permease protein